MPPAPTHQIDGPDQRWRQWAIASIVLVAALCYANALANGYVQDDQGIIHDNPLVQTVTGLWRAFAHPYWPEHNGAGQYRPLVIDSFVIDRGILHLGAWWIHLVNIGWHVAVSVLVWRVLSTMLSVSGAWFGGLWFALHPVHVEAVSNGVGRCELMATAFVLLAWLAHWEKRPVAVLYFAAALASKEVGIVFLGLAAAHDLIVGSSAHWRRPFVERRRWYAAYAGVCAVYAGALLWVFRSKPFVVTAVTWDHATMLQRWLTMLRVVPEYARLLLAPIDLKVDYTPRTIDLVTGVTPAVVVGCALLAATLLVLVALWRRAPAVSYGVVWFIVAISPVSNVLFPSGVVLAERTLYLPSVGAAIIAGWIFERALVVRPRFSAVFATVLCVAFALRTWTRTPFWHDKRQFLMREVSEQPESYRAHYTVCVLLSLEHHWSEAATECQVARRLHGSDVGPYVTGAQVALGARQTLVADALLDSAKQLSPGDYATLYTLAELRRTQGRPREAIALAFSAYESAPDSVQAIDQLTSAAQALHDYVDAEAAFRRGLADHPANVHLREGYAAMLMDRGDSAAGRQQLALAHSDVVQTLFSSQ